MKMYDKTAKCLKTRINFEMTTNKMKKIYLSFIVCFFIALIAPLAISTISNISLSSPADNLLTNATTLPFSFTVTGDLDSSCTLYIDNTNYGTNASVLNNTLTSLSANIAPLADGTHSWNLSCTDANNTYSSSTRTLKTDRTAPSIALESPADSLETSIHRMSFEFTATDNLASSSDCELYVDDDSEDSMSASNDTKKTFSDVLLDSGSHDWYVKCTDDAGNTGASETRSIEVQAYCENGERGDIEIMDVSSPDSEDEFAPGSNITVKVKVKNGASDDFDVVLEADLYDVDEDDSVADDDVTTEIKEGDSETITLYLIVPSDADESDEFTVRVKAYEKSNEDEQCAEDGIAVSIKKDDHDLAFDNVEFGQDIVPCGSIADLAFDISNTGSDDEDVKVEISSSFFNTTKTFSVDEGDDYQASTPIDVPRNISDGDYTITIKAYYDYYSSTYHKSESTTATLKVQGNCIGPSKPDASFQSSQISEAFTGSDFSVRLKITNTGNGKTTYTVSASNYSDWATLGSIEPETLALDEGSSGYVYITLNPNDDAEGTNSFKALVSFGDTTKEQTVSVTIKNSSEAAAWFDRFKFEMKRNWQWFALIVILIVAVIILAVVLARQSRHYARRARDERFTPAEIAIRKANGKKGRIVRNF